MPSYLLPCRFCGYDFTAARSDARYCSPSHRSQASQRARRLADEREQADKDLALMVQARAAAEAAHDTARVAELNDGIATVAARIKAAR